MAANNQSYHVSLALFFCLGLLAIQVTSRAIQDDSIFERHEQWMTHYGKVYKDPQEREKRLRIFTENVKYIEASNNAGINKPFKLGINQFADLTNEEFIASRNKFKGHMCSSIIRTTTFKYENTSVPSTVDWRKKGAVTPVKNQGQCGKCVSN
jgi:KDEL-tailed cysteine endopeptidase